MLDQINLDLKPSGRLFYFFILINLGVVGLLLPLPLSLIVKSVLGFAVGVLAVRSLYFFNRNNNCHLSLFDGQWHVSYGSLQQGIATPRVKFMTAHWLVLTIKLDGELFCRTLYLTPQGLGDKNFRGLCRYFRFMS